MGREDDITGVPGRNTEAETPCQGSRKGAYSSNCLDREKIREIG